MRSNLQLIFLNLFFVFFTSTGQAAGPQCGTLFGSLIKGPQIFKNSRGEKIAMKVSGNPQSEKVVLLLNGIDRDMSEWDKVLARLIKRNPETTYIQIDLFGQGETSNLTPLKQIHYSKQIELLEEIFSRFGLTQKHVTLISHSYGGAIAARFVQDHPGTITENIMIAPFVDFLETYTPGLMVPAQLTKFYSYFFGMKDVYENTVQLAASLGTSLTWPAYVMQKQTNAKLSDVIALTNGVRDVGMTEAVAHAGTTRTSIIYSGLDELIPTEAHLALWKSVADDNRGAIIRIPATHEAVSLMPQVVFEALAQLIP